MSSLSQQRCFNHAGREAVARCTSCERFFCRECVTEHEDRMICAHCLAGRAEAASASQRPSRVLFGALQFCLGLLILWYAFYGMGRMLLAAPDDFHEATLWRTKWWETE